MEVIIFCITLSLISGGALVGFGYVLGKTMAERKLRVDICDHDVSVDGINNGNVDMGYSNEEYYGRSYRCNNRLDTGLSEQEREVIDMKVIFKDMEFKCKPSELHLVMIEIAKANNIITAMTDAKLKQAFEKMEDPIAETPKASDTEKAAAVDSMKIAVAKQHGFKTFEDYQLAARIVKEHDEYDTSFAVIAEKFKIAEQTARNKYKKLKEG